MLHLCMPPTVHTSNSSADDKDFHRSVLETVPCKACSAATKISASLMGRSIELSKIPGEELVRDITLACTFCNEGILNDASEPELPSYCNYITTRR